LLLYTTIIRSAGFFIDYPRAYKEDSILFNLFDNLIPAAPIETLIGILLVFSQASLINFLVNKNNYDRFGSLFPGVFYVIFVSIIPDFLGLSPALIANTFIILALIQISRLYKKHKPTKIIFNIGWLIGTAIIFYLPNILFVLTAVIGLFSIRAQNIKELFQLFSGVFLSILLLFSFCFLIGSLDTFKTYIQLDIGLFRPSSPHFWYVFGVILLWVVFLALKNRSLVLKKSIVVSKNINLLYWFLLFAALSFFMGQNEFVQFKYLLIVIPMSVLTGLYFIGLKSKWIPEIIHLLLLVVVAFTHYQLPIPYLSQ